MSGGMVSWTAAEQLTLRLGPIWVLSALTGRCRFDADEQAAFWDVLTEVARHRTGLAREVAEGVAADRRWLFDEFELDNRPIVSGLNAVNDVLERVDPGEASYVRLMLLQIGERFARARGPFGRRITTEDQQTLALVDQLLETDSETARHNPLNSQLPI